MNLLERLSVALLLWSGCSEGTDRPPAAATTNPPNVTLPSAQTPSAPGTGLSSLLPTLTQPRSPYLSCHRPNDLSAWSLQPLGAAPGPDYAIDADVHVNLMTNAIDPVYQSSSYAGYDLNESMGGYETGLALRVADGHSYRFLISAYWDEVALWSSCAGVLAVHPVTLEEGRTYHVRAAVSSGHLTLSVDGAPLIDVWDTVLPLGAGDPALLVRRPVTVIEDTADVQVDGLKVTAAPPETGAAPPHTPRFSVRPWKDLQWGFDGDEPIFAFGPDPTAYELKLMPGYHPQVYSTWYAQSYTGSAFVANQILSFQVKEQGSRLVMQLLTEDPRNRIQSGGTITVTYDPASGTYRYDHTTNIVVPKGVTLNVDTPIDYADPNLLNGVPPASVGRHWPSIPMYSVYQQLAGGLYKQPLNHADWYPGYGTPEWYEQQMNALQPDGGFWLVQGDPVVAPRVQVLETPARAGEMLGQMCNWAFDWHMQWSPPNGVLTAGSYSIHWALGGVRADDADLALSRASFATPGDLSSTWLLYTGGAGHVETFDRVVPRASPFGEYTWGDGGLQDTTVGRLDRTSLRMEGPQIAGNLLGDSQYMDPLVPDSDYELSVWVKTESVQGVGPGLGLAGDVYYPGVVGTNDWRRIGFKLHTSPDETVLRQVPFFLHHDGSGKVWFDDFLLRRVTAEQPIDPALDRAPRRPAQLGTPRADLTLWYSSASEATPADPTLLDLSGRGNHGRRVGAAWVMDGKRRVLEMDGRGSHAEMLGHPSADLAQAGTGAASLCAWVKPLVPNEGTQQTIVSGGDDRSSRWYMVLLPWDDKWQLVGVVNGVMAIGDYFEVPVGEWAHACMTHDGQKISMYVNGVLTSRESAPGSWLMRGDFVRLGTLLSGQPADNLNGRIGAVKFFPAVLTNTQVQAEFAAGF